MENPLNENNPEGIQWSWVDFSMGEDVRSESRLLQDETWSNAVTDGRSHVSHREYSNLHCREFINAIDDYKTVKILLAAYYTESNILNKLSVELLAHVVDFALAGQGPLVAAGDLIRNAKIAALEATELARTLNGNERKNGKDSSDFNSFRITARCRPLFGYEKEGGAYNTVDTLLTSSELVVHDGKLARGGRWLTMSHKTFPVDKIWRADATNQDVCFSEVEPLLSRVREGHSSSLLCFGQTGTGKTYTLVAALEYILKSLMGSSVEVTFFEIHGKKCYDLFSHRNLVHLRSDENEVVHVRGARSLVSLSPSEQIDLNALYTSTKDITTSVTVEENDIDNEVEDIDEYVARDNSKAPELESVDYIALVKAVREALTIRSSEVTERNPISSRSHAVCVIKLLSPPCASSSASASSTSGTKIEFEGNGSTQLKYYGKLTLVDLAGSERNYETTKMSAFQHRESADINFALMALKDCFRAYFAQSLGPKTMLKLKTPGGSDIVQPVTVNAPSDCCPTRAPYRASPLTRVLRECFVDAPTSNSLIDKKHHTTIITTLSPTPADVQHSLNSLEHVVLMNPALQAKVYDVIVEVPLLEGFLSGIPISAWTADQVLFWLSTTNNGRFAQLVLPPGLDGNGLMKLNMVSLSALCEGTLRAARQDEEGCAWVVRGVAAEDISANATHNYLGRALWAALRREQQLQRLSSQSPKPLP